MAPEMKKKLLVFLCFCLLIPFFWATAKAETASLRKKDHFNHLPQRPELALKRKPERSALDFLAMDTQTISEDPFFQTAAFIGDSITKGLSLIEAFDSLPIMANLGLTLTKAKNNLEDWQADHVETIFILLGINDMTYYYMDTETYIARYGELVSALETRFPEALIIIQSILPVTHDYLNPRITNENIASYNQALKEFCEQERIPFANISDPFCLKDGSLNPEMSPDGLHLFYRYYGAWLAQLRYVADYS
jgi:lysophospholipase L1-like esterase